MFTGLIEERGTERAQYIMRSLMQRASAQSVALPYVTTTDYVNTIPADQEPEYPGDEELERRYRNYLRWNAAMMVVKANKLNLWNHDSSNLTCPHSSCSDVVHTNVKHVF